MTDTTEARSGRESRLQLAPFTSPRAGLTALLLLFSLACGGEPLVLPAEATGTALFEQAEAELAEEDWSKAIDAYDTLLRNYPSSPHLPAARIGLGRAYYEQNRTDSLLLAVDAFQNFLTYHPSHQQVDYAQLMIGMCYVRLMRSVDRDQSNTRRAVREFRNFIEDYPDSTYMNDAQSWLQEAIDRLAGHELRVARWQLDRGFARAARQRIRYALSEYGGTSLGCDLIFTLAEAYQREGSDERAAVYYGQVVSDYPTCEYAAMAAERLERGGPSSRDR